MDARAMDPRGWVRRRRLRARPVARSFSSLDGMGAPPAADADSSVRAPRRVVSRTRREAWRVGRAVTGYTVGSMPTAPWLPATDPLGTANRRCET